MVAAAAVLVRQVSVWIVAPVALSALIEWRSRDRASFTPVVIAAVVASLVPLGVAIAFFLLWNGLTPPVFQSQHASGPDPATPIAALALAGVYGFFFAGPRGVREEMRHTTSVAIALVVFVSAMLVPSSFDRDVGRWGGWIWELVRETPIVYDRSIVLVPLAALGVLVVGALGRRAAAAGHAREATMILVALVMWLWRADVQQPGVAALPRAVSDRGAHLAVGIRARPGRTQPDGVQSARACPGADHSPARARHGDDVRTSLAAQLTDS